MKLLFGALLMLLMQPNLLLAEEVEIQLVEVQIMGTISGDNPLDGNDHMGDTPTRPNDFRATIDGNVLNVTIEEPSITSAQLRVYRQSTLLVNHSFYIATTEVLPSAGNYTLEIQTDGGMLVGNFNVQ